MPGRMQMCQKKELINLATYEGTTFFNKKK